MFNKDSSRTVFYIAGFVLTRVGQSGLCVCGGERCVCGGGEGSGQSDRPSTLKKKQKSDSMFETFQLNVRLLCDSNSCRLVYVHVWHWCSRHRCSESGQHHGGHAEHEWMWWKLVWMWPALRRSPVPASLKEHSDIFPLSIVVAFVTDGWLYAHHLHL